MSKPFKKVFIIVLDGFGLAGSDKGNAILKAKTPYIDSLVKTYPAMSVAAAGLVVGLPWGQPGNSEVGHSAIGTGRIMIQDLARINGEIRSGDFFKNDVLLEAIKHAKKHDSALHLIGCTSSGGIHAHTDHLIALLEMAGKHKLGKVFVHMITDGQDMPSQDAVNVLHALEPVLKKFGARIASMCGRSYAMDRVLNWKLSERVWHAIVVGDETAITDPHEYLESSYKKKFNDYLLEPATVVDSEGNPVGAVNDNDTVIFYNFRNDRVKQIAAPFVFGNEFKEFDMVKRLKNVNVVTMTKYAEDFTVPYAYEAMELPHALGEILSHTGAGQWRIAEKEKEAHVTNFFNGGRIHAFKKEQRIIVSSRMMRGKEYIEHPEMSAEKILDAVSDHIEDDARLYVVNFANPDMIGHTGNMSATVKAVEVVDHCLQRLIDKLLKRTDTAVIITADHGNAEELLDPLTEDEDTQHSTRNVPAIFIAPTLNGKGDMNRTLESLAQEAPIGTLVDISPSALYLLGIKKPDEMSGSNIIPIE